VLFFLHPVAGAKLSLVSHVTHRGLDHLDGPQCCRPDHWGLALPSLPAAWPRREILLRLWWGVMFRSGNACPSSDAFRRCLLQVGVDLSLPWSKTVPAFLYCKEGGSQRPPVPSAISVALVGNADEAGPVER